MAPLTFKLIQIAAGSQLLSTLLPKGRGFKKSVDGIVTATTMSSSGNSSNYGLAFRSTGYAISKSDHLVPCVATVHIWGKHAVRPCEEQMHIVQLNYCFPRFSRQSWGYVWYMCSCVCIIITFLKYLKYDENYMICTEVQMHVFHNAVFLMASWWIRRLLHCMSCY